jgi:MoaA/NifB/PqqE/SkfB family radical SAM enzyme
MNNTLCQKNNQLKIVVDSFNDEIKYSRCSFTTVSVLKGIENFSFSDIKKSNLLTKKREEYINDCLDICADNKIDIIDFNSFTGCNFNCYHCFLTDHKVYNKNINDTFFILDKLKNNNIELLCLDGRGEIFLVYDKLCDFLKSLKLSDFKKIFFITNGSLLDKEKIMNLKKISDITGLKYIFNLSIDGITKETYEATRIGGNFEKVINNLFLLKKFFDIKITFTIKSTNIKDVPNVVNFFKSLGIKNDDLIIGRDFFEPKYIAIQKNLEEEKNGLC